MKPDLKPNLGIALHINARFKIKKPIRFLRSKMVIIIFFIVVL